MRLTIRFAAITAFALALGLVAAPPASAQYLGRAVVKASKKTVVVHGVEGRKPVALGESRWIKVPNGNLSWEDRGIRRFKNVDRGTRFVHVQRGKKGRMTLVCYGKNAPMPRRRR